MSLHILKPGLKTLGFAHVFLTSTRSEPRAILCDLREKEIASTPNEKPNAEGYRKEETGDERDTAEKRKTSEWRRRTAKRKLTTSSL